jgi:tetratricopeptide (TPR) repeat protein
MDDQSATHACAFCGRTNEEVACLFAGPIASICDECAKLAANMLTDLKDRESGHYYKRVFVAPLDAVDHFWSGRRYLALKMHEMAILEFDEAIRLLPHFNAARYNRANVLMKLGRLDDALTDLSCVIHFEPVHADAYKSRGLAHLDLKFFDKAIGDLTESIRLNASSVSAHVARGRALEAGGDLASAVRDYSTALATPPDGEEEELAYDAALDRLVALSGG